jgi:4-hydroxy-tetrahydrodipicolinate synthase
LPFSGVVVPVVTPYRGRDLSVDVEAFRWLVSRLAEAGVQGVFVAGTTGEKELLSVGEIAGLVEAAVGEVDGRLRVFAGTPSARVSEALEAAKAAGEAGADHVMTTPPLYFNPGPAGVVEFYRKLALASGDATVYVYTIPSHVGYNVAPETVEALAGEGVAEGIKATVADSLYIVSLSLRVKSRFPEFTLLAGYLETLPLALAHGWDGVVDALANVAPGIALGMIEAWRDGDTRRLSALTRLAASLSEALRPHGLQAGLKALLAEMGAPVERLVRQPLTPAPAGAVAQAKKMLCREARDLLLPGLKC